MQSNLNKTLKHILLCALMINNTFGLKAHDQLRDVIKKCNELNNHSAYFLARSILSDAIQSEKEKINYDPVEVGEAYQTLSHSNYNIGFSLEYKDNIDSMYLYKRKSSKRIYFVEYAAYQLRSYALDHNYLPAMNLLRQAKAALDSNRNDAELIDTLFFRVNELNIQRNFRQNGQSQVEFFEHKWNLIKEYEKIDWNLQNDPLKRAIYYRFLGNFFQDFVRYNDKYHSRHWSEIAKEKCINYYKLGISEIEKGIGFQNEAALRFQMLIALQYGKNIPDKDSCLKLFSEISDKMTFSPNDKSYYRSISLPLSINKIYASYILKFSADSLISTIEEALENSQRMRRLFVSQHTKSKEDWLNEGYSLNTNDELIAIYIYQLKNKFNYQDSLEIIKKIWNLQSIRYQQTNYLEAVRRTVGTKYFNQLNSKLDSLELLRLSLIDQYYLTTLEKRSDLRVKELRDKIDKLDSIYTELIDSMNPILEQYETGKPQQSLSEFMENLEDDQACLIQINNPLIGNHSRTNFFQLIISRNKAEILVNNNYASRLYWKLLKSKNYDEKLWKKRSFAGYYNFFQSAHSKLAQFKRIRVQTSPQSADLSYGYFISDTTFQNIRSSPYLIKEFAFSYTQNLSVDYLNSREEINQNRNFVFKSNCDENNQRSDIPFTYQFADKLKNDWGFQSLNSKNSIFNKDKTYNHLFFFSHGYADSSLFTDYYNYKSQDMINHNYILACGERISISEIDSIDIRGTLVILSNCHSGEGYIDPHSSKIDLGKVFLKNGSHTVISTLSEIDDQSTSIILKDFLKHLSDGKHPSLALQKAQLNFIKGIKDPTQFKEVYWAGLTVNGLDLPIKLNKDQDYLYLLIAGSILAIIFLLIKIIR